MNPYLPSWEYVPDAEPRVFGDRLYVFGSHDRFRGRKYCQNDYVGWSAPLSDLSDWTSHGVIYRRDQDIDNANGRRALWAPDVVAGADGRFYLYYGMQFHPRISVAVADRPEGPYAFLGHVSYATGVPLGATEGDAFPFDPGVLVDDDGRVFLYFGFGPAEPFLQWQLNRKKVAHEGGYVVELEANMTTIVSGPRLIVPMVGKSDGSGFENHEFYEAASIRRIGDTYYFVWSSINGHELCYATSSKPDRDFEFGGILISNGDIGFHGRSADDALNYTANNHGGLVEIRGQWFIFYHRHTNGVQVSRQGMAEPITFVDGHFEQAEMTSAGLTAGALQGLGTYSAHHACVLRSGDGVAPVPYLRIVPSSKHPYFTQSGRDRESGGDQYIANMRQGAVAGFKYFDLRQTSAVTIDVRGKGRGLVEIATQLEGPALATIAVPAAVGTRASAALPTDLGASAALYFRFRGEGSVEFHSFTLA